MQQPAPKTESDWEREKWLSERMIAEAPKRYRIPLLTAANANNNASNSSADHLNANVHDATKKVKAKL